MSRREELVRREKDLMVRYHEAHKSGDKKYECGVMSEFQRNAQQIKHAGKTG